MSGLARRKISRLLGEVRTLHVLTNAGNRDFRHDVSPKDRFAVSSLVALWR